MIQLQKGENLCKPLKLISSTKSSGNAYLDLKGYISFISLLNATKMFKDCDFQIL